MDKKILALLKKIYHHENGSYNASLDCIEHAIPSAISKEDLELLKSNGFSPNTFETFKHDDVVARLLKIRDNKKLTLEFVTAFFLKGITGEFPRGRQALMSFVYLKHLSEHSFEGKDTCEICGIPKKETEDRTDQLYSYYLGHSWNEFPLHFLLDLEEMLSMQSPKVTKDDKEMLKALLLFIEQADASETPGKLEKRIASKKLLPKTDKYMRYGILQTLAECGILPNELIEPKYENFTTVKEHWAASKKMKGSSRSDIVLPLAGWKGSTAVDWKRVNAIFGRL